MYALTSRKDELPSSRESREANYASDARTMQSTSWRGGASLLLRRTIAEDGSILLPFKGSRCGSFMLSPFIGLPLDWEFNFRS